MGNKQLVLILLITLIILMTSRNDSYASDNNHIHSENETFDEYDEEYEKAYSIAKQAMDAYEQLSDHCFQYDAAVRHPRFTDRADWPDLTDGRVNRTHDARRQDITFRALALCHVFRALTGAAGFNFAYPACFFRRISAGNVKSPLSAWARRRASEIGAADDANQLDMACL